MTGCACESGVWALAPRVPGTLPLCCEQTGWPWRRGFAEKRPSFRKRVRAAVEQARGVRRGPLPTHVLFKMDPKASSLKSLGRGLCFSALWQSKKQTCCNQADATKRMSHCLACLKSVRKVFCKIQLLYSEWLSHKTN